MIPLLRLASIASDPISWARSLTPLSVLFNCGTLEPWDKKGSYPAGVRVVNAGVGTELH